MQIARPRTPMGQLWSSIQSWLFPMLEDEIGELDERHRQFVAVCELCAPQDHMDAYRWCGNGCPPRDRLALCKAFIAKAVRHIIALDPVGTVSYFHAFGIEGRCGCSAARFRFQGRCPPRPGAVRRGESRE